MNPTRRNQTRLNSKYILDEALINNTLITIINASLNRYSEITHFFRSLNRYLDTMDFITTNTQIPQRKGKFSSIKGELFETIIYYVLQLIYKYSGHNGKIYNANCEDDYEMIKSCGIHIKQGGTQYANGVDIICIDDYNWRAIQCKNRTTSLDRSELYTLQNFIFDNYNKNMATPLLILSNKYPDKCPCFNSIKTIKYTRLEYGLKKTLYEYIEQCNDRELKRLINDLKYTESIILNSTS